MHDGFGLNSGITIEGGDGALLVSGEAFAWRPWEVTGEKKLVNDKGQFELPREAFGLFDVLWPRPGMFFSCLRVCVYIHQSYLLSTISSYVVCGEELTTVIPCD